MPTIIIDGESYEADADRNLLEVCIQLGLEIPYFCWHPSIGSVGSCRQCAVKQYRDENDERGAMVMSCMTPVTDGMIISLKDQATQEFRDNCIESVMSNHPHDCPVCEEGGECHLQDMTNLSEHTVRYYDGKKRTFKNQKLGPFINHEMNRCITCYRCVRYYEDVAGGTDLQAQGSSNWVYFGRDKDGTLESPFSGNLVEICPTGVFTDRTFSNHFTRKWDLQTAPSICTHCSLGCNTSPGERYGILRRVVNRYHGEVNGYFLCDRGRFGYDYVNGDNRLTTPLIQEGDKQVAISAKECLEKLSQLSAGGTKIGIGSPRASLEANYALLKMVGKDNFYAGVSHDEQQANNTILSILSNAPAEIATLTKVKTADAVLILGEDILNTAPLLALSVREASKNKGKELASAARIPLWQAAAVKNITQTELSPVYNLTPAATDIDDIAELCYHATPNNLARIGMAIAHAIDSSAPAVTDLSDSESTLAQQIASTLTAASRPLVISGSGCEDTSVIEASANIANALNTHKKDTLISLVCQNANSLGLSALIADNPDADVAAAVKRVLAKNDASITAVVLETDLSQQIESSILEDFEQTVDNIVVLDHLNNKTTAKADLVIPAATFAESEGTFLSSEGRAQRYFAVHSPADKPRSSWSWLNKATPHLNVEHFDELTAACAEEFPILSKIIDAAPDAAFRISGKKVARQPHRYSGRGSMYSHIDVDETRRPYDAESALSFSMEGLHKDLPPALQPDIWHPAWNSVEAVNKMQNTVGGHLKGGDPGMRLFEQQEKQPAWFEVPAKQEQDNGYQAVTLYHIFGSDELSTHAPDLEQRIPTPYVALNPDDAAALEVQKGSALLVQLGDSKVVLSVSINASLARGSVGLPRLREFRLGSFSQSMTLTKTTDPALASSVKLFFKGTHND